MFAPITETIKNIFLVWLSLFLLVHDFNFIFAVIIATIITKFISMFLFWLFVFVTNCFFTLKDKLKKN